MKLDLLAEFRLFLQEIVMAHPRVRSGWLVVIVALVIFVGACRRQQPAKPDPPPPTPPPAPIVEPPPAPKPPAPPPPTPPAPKVETPAEIFAKTSNDKLSADLGIVLFEYDRADLSDAARATLQKSAALLKEWSGYSPQLRVTIEGHADNRGTNEYNLALGERRAASVRDYLVSLGVNTATLSIVSKGEEQPACNQDSEDCWQQNRRGIFVVTQK